MAAYGPILRPSTVSSSAPIDPSPDHPSPARRSLNEFGFTWVFGVPSTPKVALVRVLKNLCYFREYYTLIVWLILFVSLVPKRHESLIFLVALTAVAYLYNLLTRAIHDSVVSHKVIDPRLVLALIGIIVIVELVITKAIVHLLVSLAIGVPIILVHAILRVSNDIVGNQETFEVGELVSLVGRAATSNQTRRLYSSLILY
ncbi:PRA1 family protein F3-like [Tasmannia lanceolata]|uniref:PRA1 family protein F3-like n=1 Tax=Tasmannia lanceolata TaxID=3420 RepID=UPI004062E8C2